MGKYFCHFVVFYVSYALNLFCSSLPSFLPSFAFIDFLKIIYCIYSFLISFLVYFLVVFFKSKEYSEHLKLKITLNLYHFSLSMRRRQWHPLQYSCLENPMDGGACQAAIHGVAKSWTRLSGFTFTFHFHALEKEMATHCSVLAWRIPGTGEPGGLPSMALHRVGHD